MHRSTTRSRVARTATDPSHEVTGCASHEAHRLAEVGFGRDEGGGLDYRGITLAAGDTALDAVEIAIAHARRAQAALVDSVNSKLPEVLARWEAVREELVALGAPRGRAAVESSAVQRKIERLAVACGAPAHVITGLSTPVVGDSAVDVLLALMRIAGDTLAKGCAVQNEAFWRVALRARPSDLGLLGGQYDEVHLFDSATETAFDWSSRARAIDMHGQTAALRKAMTTGTPIAADAEQVWFIDAKQRVHAVDTKPSKFTSAVLDTVDTLAGSIVAQL